MQSCSPDMLLLNNVTADIQVYGTEIPQVDLYQHPNVTEIIVFTILIQLKI